MTATLTDTIAIHPDGDATSRRPRRGLTGTGRMLRFVLRRDRVRLPVWILAVVGLTLATVASLPSYFATAGDRQDRAELIDNPATVALIGPGYGTDDYTFGAMVANEYTAFLAITVAIMSILLVTRHTRAEEEGGGAELIRATAVGRHAMTTAALLVVAATNLVIGGLLAVGLPATLDELPFGSSALFGAGIAAVGLVFTGIAAVTAQVTEYPRAASGLAVAVLAGTYVLRGIGDVGNGALSWLSPIGWSQATKAYVDDRWWPLLLSVVLAAGATVAAYVIAARRDLGAGVLSQRRGRAGASPGLTRPIGFALRLQRATLISWATGLLLASVLYGSLGGEAEDFVDQSDAVLEMLELDDLTEAQLEEVDMAGEFFSMVLGFMAILASGYALQSALRLRSEENADRVEPVLATALDRWRWAGSHLLLALAGAVVLLSVAGLGMGVAGAIALDDAAYVPRLLGAALVHVPSTWVLVGAAVALFGLVPRAAQWAWGVFGFSAFIFFYGPLLNLPSWVSDVSPFGHTPRLPSEELDLVPLVAMTAIAAALTWVGLYGFRRRDIEMS